MTCKDCIHHEALKERDDYFYCEAYNDIFPDDDSDGAERECEQFTPCDEGD